MVVMDAFRSIHMNNIAMRTEPRISTSNSYYTKPIASREAKLRGLNRIYYNMTINAQTVDKNDIKMLKSFKMHPWTNCLVEKNLINLDKDQNKTNAKMKELSNLALLYKD